jgi:DedD protein
MNDQDTEITLGAGKLLGLFFGLVVLCAVFFGAGYMVGKSIAGPTVAAAEPSTQTANGSGAPKPSSAVGGSSSAKTADCPAGSNCGQPTSSDLSFYKNVEQKDPNTEMATQEPDNSAEQKPAPEVSKSAAPAVATTPAGGYVVQVAAVSKEQDAEALVSALRRKQYPVFVSTVGSDKLLHVQAGPFADPKEAEVMRTRLVNDGYNPILKR